MYIHQYYSFVKKSFLLVRIYICMYVHNHIYVCTYVQGCVCGDYASVCAIGPNYVKYQQLLVAQIHVGLTEK